MIPKIELKSKKEIKEFQEKKLNKLLTYLINNSKYYRNLFKKNNIDINGINSIEDLEKIPVTTKEQLHKYNKEFICVPEISSDLPISLKGLEASPKLKSI